jgi:hypothetical protein
MDEARKPTPDIVGLLLPEEAEVFVILDRALAMEREQASVGGRSGSEITEFVPNEQ